MEAALAGMAAGACGAACGLSRHLQGGAGPRWVAMLLLVPVTFPTFYAYGWHAIFWPDYIVAGLLAAALFLNQTMAQEFGNLWLGFARNCAIIAFLALVTGFPPVVVFSIPVFLVLKWAREPHDGDRHQTWEWVEGACVGMAYGIAPLMRGW